MTILLPESLLNLTTVLVTFLCVTFASGCTPPQTPVIDALDPLESVGAYAVLVQDIVIPNSNLADGDINATLYWPSSDGINIASGSFDMQIMLPGFSGQHGSYTYFSEHLASHGSLVIGMTLSGSTFQLDGEHDKKVQQVVEVVDYALANFAANIDSNKIGIVGHSQGGKLAFYAAAIDNRIALVSTMDPVNSGGAPCFVNPGFCAAYPVAPNPGRGLIGLLNDVSVPSLILRSAPDAAINPEEEFNASYFFYGSDGAGLNGAPSPALYFDMGSTGHGDYVPGLSATSYAPALSKRTITAWIQKHLYGQNVEDYLTGTKVSDAISFGWMLAVDSR